jgi:hypothetical protein
VTANRRGFTLSRLRAGEAIAGMGGVLLLVFMFVLKWYGLGARPSKGHAGVPGATSWTGWQQLPVLRWLLLVTGICAIALAYLQVTRRAPALPVTFSLIATVLGAVSAVALVVRVLISPPSLAATGSLDRLSGAYLGLFAALAIAYGGFASMRQEQGTDPAELGELETLRV